MNFFPIVFCELVLYSKQYQVEQVTQPDYFCFMHMDFSLRPLYLAHVLCSSSMKLFGVRYIYLVLSSELNHLVLPAFFCLVVNHSNVALVMDFE